MKRLLKLFALVLVVVISTITFTGCDLIDDTLGSMIEVDELRAQNKVLSDENEQLKKELATLKFELVFPNGLVDESCILNSVEIVRTDVVVDGSVYAVKTTGENVEVVINNGKYDAGCGSLYNISIWAHDKSHIIINGGEFITNDDVNGDANHCIYASGGSLIEIKGGLFYSNGSSEWLINCQDNTDSQIIITGGTFIDFNPSDCISEGEHTNFVPEGYMVVSEVVNQGQEDEYTLYTVVEGEPVVDDEITSNPDEF